MKTKKTKKTTKTTLKTIDNGVPVKVALVETVHEVAPVRVIEILRAFRIPRVKGHAAPKTVRLSLGGKTTLPTALTISPSAVSPMVLMLSAFYNRHNGDIVELAARFARADSLPANDRAAITEFTPLTALFGRPVDLSLQAACTQTWADDGAARYDRILARRAGGH